MKHRYALADTNWVPKGDSLDDWLGQYEYQPRGFGHQRRDPLATCDTRIIGDFELIYVLGGESIVNFGATQVRLGAGSFLLIPPFFPHSIDTPSTDPHDNFWIHFDVGPAHLQPRFLSEVRAFCGKRLVAIQTVEWEGCLSAFERASDAGVSGLRVMFQSMLLHVLVLFFRDASAQGFVVSQPNGSDPGTRLRQERVRQCTELILADLRASWSAERLAGMLHVGVSTLQKAFSAEMQMPLHQFVLLSRLRRAEMCMLTTGLSLEEIAEEIGFSSGHAFNIAFRRVYRMSPRAWLRQLRDC